MRVCFVSTEYFGWGLYGGFGRLTRTLATNLVKHGVDVHVLIPRNLKTQPKHAHIEGVPIHAFGKTRLRTLWYSSLIPSIKKVAKEVDADIYHSEGETQFTLFCEDAMPKAKHIVTCQDPELEFEGDLWKKWRKTPYWGWELNKGELQGRIATIARRLLYKWMIKRGMQNADGVFSQTHYQIPLIKHTFGLKNNPSFLPNPVEVPTHKLHKNSQPTVVMLSRLDPVKRPWIYFKIAKKMPDVLFYYTGKSHVPWFDVAMRRMAKKIPNLVGLGHIHDQEIKALLEKSWILLNCSIKEALPVSWLEACAYHNAIVSCLDPDAFATCFGYHIKDEENVDAYVCALKSLISNESYLKELQNQAYERVKETYELNKVIDQHLQIYRNILN